MSSPVLASTDEQVSYNQFEADVREGIYQDASMDGNIVTLTHKDGHRLRVEVPNAPRAVELLVKFEVPVKAYRAVPASGLTWPVVVLLLIPYGVLGFYAFALASAARATHASPSGLQAEAGGRRPETTRSRAEERGLDEVDELDEL